MAIYLPVAAPAVGQGGEGRAAHIIPSESGDAIERGPFQSLLGGKLAQVLKGGAPQLGSKMAINNPLHLLLIMQGRVLTAGTPGIT